MIGSSENSFEDYYYYRKLLEIPHKPCSGGVKERFPQALAWTRVIHDAVECTQSLHPERKVPEPDFVRFEAVLDEFALPQRWKVPDG